MDDCATYCGVRTTTHALSSVRAAESALNIDVPVNAQYIRNIILAAHTTHDHIVHFLSAFGAGLGGHHFCTAS
ncbi:nickel-dependent hydrogenase large subunit [Escherichia coli]